MAAEHPDNPTDGKLDFYGNKGQGILEDPEDPHGSAGDPAAIEDLQQENYVPPMAFGINSEDGIPMPMPGDQREPNTARVDVDNFVCLTCDHYVEMIATVAEDDEGNRVRETQRRCLAIKNWAELGDLAEAEIFSCSQHSDPYKRGECTNPALCAQGDCRRYVEMQLQGPLDPEPQTTRWCLLLGGAARFFDLRGRLVEACNHFDPRAWSKQATAAYSAGLRVAKQVRDERADSE